VHASHCTPGSRSFRATVSTHTRNRSANARLWRLRCFLGRYSADVDFGESHFAPSKPAQVGKEHVGELATGAVQPLPLHLREIIPTVPFHAMGVDGSVIRPRTNAP
jgi:hypothetical protein